MPSVFLTARGVLVYSSAIPFNPDKMGDFERTVLEFYQVSTPYPVEWPTDKNNSDVSDDETTKSKINRRKSRYQALERAVINRGSVVPGSENSGSGGVANLVQKDEPDPLGTTDSVVRTLKQMGLPLQDDPRLRRPSYSCSSHFSIETDQDPFRQPVPSLVHDILPRLVLVTDARHRRYPITSNRS